MAAGPSFQAGQEEEEPASRNEKEEESRETVLVAFAREMESRH